MISEDVALSMFCVPRDPYRSDLIRTEALLEYLGIAGFLNVELVPSLLFGRYWSIPPEGLSSTFPSVTSVQSLTFGVPFSLGAPSLSGAAPSLWHERLQRVNQLSSIYPHLTYVLGSPSQRTLAPGQSVASGVGSFLLRATELLAAIGPDDSLVIEPNPANQGAQFLTSVFDVLTLLESASQPRLGVCLDIACIANISPDEWLSLHARLRDLDPPLHVQVDPRSLLTSLSTFREALKAAAQSKHVVGVSLEDPQQPAALAALEARLLIQAEIKSQSAGPRRES